MDFEVIGKNIPNLSAPPKAQGRSKYLDDIKLQDMLYCKVLRSPYPHAKILSIDTSRAKSHPGVKAVISGYDIPPIKWGNTHQGFDQYTLAIDKVRYVGDHVAAVAAIDEETAEEALDLIKVEYEPLPAVFDPLESMKPGASLIHEDRPGNIANHILKSFGDVGRGFQECDLIREDTYSTVPNNHAPMEPHGDIALWNSDGSLTMWATCQSPFMLRRGLCSPLGLAEDKVRIIRSEVGGGFGGKVETFPFQLVSAHLSRLTGRPVKIILTREEVFIGTRHRHPTIIKLKTGFKKDGTLVAQDGQYIVDCGAHMGLGPLMMLISSYMLMLPYILPHFRFEGTRVYTNKPVCGPLRGHGAPQVRFAMESQLDMIAEELKIDPIEIRIKNAIYTGYKHPAKQEIFSCSFKEDIQAVAKALKWKERKGKLPEGHGIGIGCSGLFCGVKIMFHAGGSAVISISVDGGVNIHSGGTDIGQGVDTVVAQIVAEELGCRFEDIHMITGDTLTVPFDFGTFGSGVTLRMGNAAMNAAREVKKQLLEAVAPRLEVSPQELEARGGKIFVRGQPDKGISFKEAVKIYRYAGNPQPIVGRGYWEPDVEVGVMTAGKDGQFSPTYAFIAQGAEVKVDKETGEVKVLKVITADECGQILNPTMVEGQLDGSVFGGLGMAFYEEHPHIDGKYLNTSFLDYLIPTSLDGPDEMPSLMIETLDPKGPYGAKEAGEGNLVPTTPAIANAIYDAIGVRINELPITPDKILKALERKGGKA